MMIEDIMRMAIDEARKGVEVGDGGPFGACVFRDGEVIACAHNTVFKDTDPTAHAEVNAIRLAARRLGRIDLTGLSIATTAEPCPMCLSAIHWARIGRIYYGVPIKKVAEYGFNEIPLSSEHLNSEGHLDLKIKGGILEEECLHVFELWRSKGHSPY